LSYRGILFKNDGLSRYNSQLLVTFSPKI